MMADPTGGTARPWPACSRPRQTDRIFAACGCAAAGIDDLVQVRLRAEHCDPAEGFVKAVMSGAYCPACAARLRGSPEWIGSDAEAAAWLSSA